MATPIAELLERRLDKSGGQDSCWPRVRGGKRMTFERRKRSLEVRRVAWLVAYGTVPDARQHIEVTCGNPLCCNPKHLTVPTRADRFWEKVDKGDGSGCWNWKGPFAKRGYGVLRTQAEKHGSQIRAHRFSYELAYGPIGNAELFVCHRCDNPRCVRPDHLFLGTAADNCHDMLTKGRGRNGFGPYRRTG